MASIIIPILWGISKDPMFENILNVLNVQSWNWGTHTITKVGAWNIKIRLIW